MPRHATTPSRIPTVEEAFRRQQALEVKKQEQRRDYQAETLKNATAIGREITRIRDSANVTRKQACKVLGVTYSSLYFVENPDRTKLPIHPRNQLRYLEAVKQLAQGVQAAASGVSFTKGKQGRRRLAAA